MTLQEYIKERMNLIESDDKLSESDATNNELNCRLGGRLDELLVLEHALESGEIDELD